MSTEKHTREEWVLLIEEMFELKRLFRLMCFNVFVHNP